MIVPVVLSGGSGTRLWPLSTPTRPKQFLPLTGTDTLFRQTLERVSDQTLYHPPVVVANAGHEALCLAEMPAEPDVRLILEPVARNTAVAIVMAAAEVALLYGPGALLLVLPSDHWIGDLASFHAAVATAVEAAQAGRMVTFGVAPSGPEIGYGYLEAGDAIIEAPGAFVVQRFTEKPVLHLAEAMVADGRHYWNGGIFLFSAGVFLEEAARLAPDVAHSGRLAMTEAVREGRIVHPAPEALAECPDVSVDYAVMERSDRVAVVPLSANWSDVGSWDALAAFPPSAAATERVSQQECGNCYVRSDGIKVAMLGVDDLIVVASGDRILIMRKGQAQSIKSLVAEAQAV